MGKGWKMSDEAKRKMRAAWARRKLSGLPHPRLGIKHTDECRARMSAIVRQRTQRGPNHYAWKGGTKVIKHGDRGTPEHRSWRKSVFERDEFTCNMCMVYTGGGNLEAHHIKAYADYPELRYVVDNGITLCKYHHKEVHDRG